MIHLVMDVLEMRRTVILHYFEQYSNVLEPRLMLSPLSSDLAKVWSERQVLPTAKDFVLLTCPISFPDKWCLIEQFCHVNRFLILYKCCPSLGALSQTSPFSVRNRILRTENESNGDLSAHILPPSTLESETPETQCNHLRSLQKTSNKFQGGFNAHMIKPFNYNNLHYTHNENSSLEYLD
ncbi:hypothetical protein ACTXT7_008883 [Hymenolepis weldensis]